MVRIKLDFDIPAGSVSRRLADLTFESPSWVVPRGKSKGAYATLLL
jgi:hypothetical protein